VGILVSINAFFNLYFNNYGPYFSRVGVAKAYLGQCNVGREAQSELHGVAQIVGRKARRKSLDARRGACRGTNFRGLGMMGRRVRGT
jgi:hypothetical protein